MTNSRLEGRRLAGGQAWRLSLVDSDKKRHSGDRWGLLENRMFVIRLVGIRDSWFKIEKRSTSALKEHHTLIPLVVNSQSKM